MIKARDALYSPDRLVMQIMKAQQDKTKALEAQLEEDKKIVIEKKKNIIKAKTELLQVSLKKEKDVRSKAYTKILTDFFEKNEVDYRDALKYLCKTVAEIKKRRDNEGSI